jgi:hypothetical protein
MVLTTTKEQQMSANEVTSADIAERREFQRQAAQMGLTLTPWDFEWVLGGWTIDGVNAAEWIKSMDLD